ncbi:MAG: hypothetical protein K2X86_09275 [Cytophagaceae bacterium]|nr:hypothetical protein [Cytophagaceae bacterium]
MKIILGVILGLSLSISGYSQKSYHLDAQADTLFAKMVMFKKSDDIIFYIMDKNSNYVDVKGMTAMAIFSFGKNSSLPIKISAQYEDRFSISVPREYWEGFATCDFLLKFNETDLKFTFVAPVKEKKNHAESPVPGTGGHNH